MSFQSVRGILNDFMNPNSTQYRIGHVYFTEGQLPRKHLASDQSMQFITFKLLQFTLLQVKAVKGIDV